MNINEVNKYLRDNKYVLEFQGKLHITSKYIRDLRRAEVINLDSSTSLVHVVGDTGIQVVEYIETSKERFKRFVAEAEVPYRITMENGKSYTANAHNISAEKVLNKALKDGFDWRGLVASAKLYYKGRGFKQKIGNYFITGTWESEYDELVKKLGEGKIAQHIQEQMKPSIGERKMI
jgi:hypothetical protein